jgi:two-component system, LytTR family, response regulator LytT
MALKCIIVDDEPLQQEILKDYIAEISGLELIHLFNDGVEVAEFLKSNKVDLIFLDINMPGINGVDLVKRLINPPAVIFTTAYPEYAVEGFNLDAVDYLLKPISYSRFSKAVEKFLRSPDITNDNEDFILVKSGKKEFRVKIENILYIESMGDYVRMVTSNQAIITHGTMQQFLDMLPNSQFCRIHKSYLVNIGKVEYFEGNVVCISGKKLSLGKTFKETFLEVWRKIRIN